ncbi:pilus assembly protein TadG-related protein, partial [Pseudomonas aeruginosa]
MNGWPARQRGAIGILAATTLLLALICLLLVVDTGRLYLEQRNLQRVADVAALE